MSKRKLKKRRRLVNHLARRRKLMESQTSKAFSLNKIAIPVLDEGWTFSEEKGIVDNGGKIAFLFWPKTTLKQTKALYEQQKGLFYLREAKKLKISTKESTLLRRWPETMVKLNWNESLVTLESIKHRL